MDIPERIFVSNPQWRLWRLKPKVFSRTHSISIEVYHEYNFLIRMHNILLYTPAHSKIKIRVPSTAFRDNATPTKHHQRGKCTTLLLHAPSKEDVRMVLIPRVVG